MGVVYAQTQIILYHYAHHGGYKSARKIMPFNKKFCHSLGSLQGGVLATLLDNAGWFTAQPYYDKWINTVDLQVQLLLPTSEKSLRASGSILKIGKKIAFTRMEARNEDDIVVASATATFSITEKSF